MRIIVVLILSFSLTCSFAQKVALEKANQLIGNKKYESAFEVLNAADPLHQNPEIVIAKTNLCLKYFVTSIMHKFFALKDLEPEEEIMDIRGSEGSFSIFTFAPDSVIKPLLEKYPDHYNLRKTLGYYYHEVHLKYPQDWLEPDSIVIQRFLDNYKIAYDHGIYDYWSVYGIGYAYLMKQNYQSSIPFLRKSAELKYDYPSSHYNLAYAYLYTNQREKGIKSAKAAMELYEYPHYKADAARMIALMYKELKNFEKAREYYLKADTIQSNDYYTLKPLLDLEILLNKESYPDRTKQFFLVAPENPTIYKDLMEIYRHAYKTDELLTFLSSQHEQYQKDNKVNGNLHFYKAVIQYHEKDFENSRTHFEKSRELFEKVYGPNHRVFEAIDSYIRDLQ